MGIPMSRGPLRGPLFAGPAVPALVFLLLSSCATLTAPPAPATPPPSASPHAAARGAAPGTPAGTTVAANDHPNADLLAHASPLPPAPVTEVPVVDLPTPVLPRSLSIPVIPQPQIAAGAQSAPRVPVPRLGSVRVPSASSSGAPPHRGAAKAGSSSAQSAPATQGAAVSQGSIPVPALPAAPLPAGTKGSAQSGTNSDAAAPRIAPPAAKASSSPGASATAGGHAGAKTAAVGTSAGKSAPRTVYAKVGDDITIALDGQGWTFTGGTAGGERWKTGVRYESRSSDSTGTTFIFKARALGTWTLAFQEQNAASGTSTEQTFDVHVLTPGEFARTIAASGSGTSSGGASGGSGASPGSASNASANGQLAAAQWLYKEGKYTEALKAYEKAWQPDDPALTEKIAELAYRVGRYADARKYWQKNFNLTGTQYGNLAVAGLMKTATAQKDAPELRALFDSVHSLEGVSIREDLLNAGRFLYQKKDWNVAVRYLDEYLKRYNGRQGADVADYLLGEIYSGPMQNAQKAMGFFRRVVTDYPMSDYYERAKANIVYLNRQYFEIR